MAETFDPYYKWLGIPPKDQPPHYYRLLGIELFEPDRDVIDAAANRLMGYLKELAAGDDALHSQKLLNEISRARLCLLNKGKKTAYDQELRAKFEAEDAKSVTASRTIPSLLSASRRSFCKIAPWTTSGGNRVPRISLSQNGFPISRLTCSKTDSGSYTAALTASLPTTIWSGSKYTALGVLKSPSAFRIVWGVPFRSKHATTENVVPRSIPTTEAGWLLTVGYPQRGGIAASRRLVQALS